SGCRICRRCRRVIFCCVRRSGRRAFFFQAEDGIRDRNVTGVQTCALPIFLKRYRDDLLEFAELRNAIVHNRIDTDYAIAEPHLSVVESIEAIEQEITEPKKVYPLFSRKVIIFQESDSLRELLTVIRDKE